MSLKKPSKNPAKKRPTRTEKLAVMREGSEQDLLDLIRFRLSLPVHQRTNFLRKRLPGGGSCL
jgi:hypothetical protein